MGLPIWRDPDEVKVKKEEVKPDPTAAARSPIRRRPPHARRRTLQRRDSTRLPPRFERSPPPSSGFNGLRETARRGENRGVPPVSTLLESADGRSAAQTRREPTEMDRLNERERELRESILELENQADELEEEARTLRGGIASEDLPIGWDLWDESERWTWLQENVSAARPISPESLPQNGRIEGVVYTGAWRHMGGTNAQHGTLPTPPHDLSENTEAERRRNWASHPTSNDPVNGLGDRNRSPTPADQWEIMRSTIAPDTTLPSADSSFTSAAASQSFTSNTTGITEPDPNPPADNTRRESQAPDVGDSTSSLDPDDLVCNDEEDEMAAAFAFEFYRFESNTMEGRMRIARHYGIWSDQGRRRFSQAEDSRRIEIGFRLIEEAFDSAEGRERVGQLARILEPSITNDSDELEDFLFASRRDRQRTRRAHITDEQPPTPHPERYGANARQAAREASDQVHDYFRRFTADSLTASRGRNTTTSPPPRYEPVAPLVTAGEDNPIASSRVAPISPPSARSEREVGDALMLSGDEQDLSAMRRVVERLARRDDVPEEWWMSMGLNLSRTRARSPERPGRSTRAGTVDSEGSIYEL